MKKRAVVAFLTTIILTFSSALSVLAYGPTEFGATPPTLECHEHQHPVLLSNPVFNDTSLAKSGNLSSEKESATRAMCINCYNQTSLVCMDNVTYQMDKGYHMGFLGLVQTDCLTYYCGRRGVELCEFCDIIITDYGIHCCYEVHTKCGRGTVDVCPYGITYSSLT